VDCCTEAQQEAGTCDYCGGSPSYNATVNITAAGPDANGNSFNSTGIQTTYYCNVADPHGGPTGYENYQLIATINYGGGTPSEFPTVNDGSATAIFWNGTFNRINIDGCCGKIEQYSRTYTYDNISNALIYNIVSGTGTSGDPYLVVL
jgi:hypothetical protein